MKYFFCSFILGLSFAQLAFTQDLLNPVIKDYGGIYNIPEATVSLAPSQTYNIVIDVFSQSEDRNAINPALNNVARMINLHAIGGLPADQLKVVLAIHAGATYAVYNDLAYKRIFGTPNPNTGLITALKNAGVKLTVCGQSLLARSILPEELNKDIEIAVSMLTTVTTYQNQGYHLLKF